MTPEQKSQPLRLSFGLGRYADFFDRMVAALPAATVALADGTTAHPLAALSQRARSDPTIALLDAWAVVADIVSFYQDRILNEGYLPTAMEQRSLALLGRMLGFEAPSFIAAATEVAMLVDPGVHTTVTVPAGTALQATGTGGGAGPVFETASELVASPALNRLIPLQTRQPTLAADAVSVLIQGTGLRLSAADSLLLIRDGGSDGWQWVRLAVTRTTENHTLKCTEVFWGRPLQEQWEQAGTGGPVPSGSTDRLLLYVLRLGCRLFGYNAPAWSAQPPSVRRLATPLGDNPANYSEWPNFAIDLDRQNNFDLQALYSRILPDSGTAPPDSLLLLEDPQTRRLGKIGAVAPEMVSAFGLSSQVTRVTLEDRSDVRPVELRPPRFGHSATTLASGQVLIVGGVGAGGVVDHVQLFDPVTQLLTPAPPLPEPRAFHTATLVGDLLVLIGGIGADGFAADVLVLATDGSLTFKVVANAPLPTPRLRHQATAMPDGTIMVSGGCCAGDQPLPPWQGIAELDSWIDGLPATSSVTLFDPATGQFSQELQLQRERAGHSATLCPLVTNGVPTGQVVVFVGGYGWDDDDQQQAWSDAEVTVPWPPSTSNFLVATIYSAPDGFEGRFDHRATLLPTALGVLLTGGCNAQPVPFGDCWLVYMVGETPTFTQTQSLLVPRWNHVAAALPSGCVVIAGGETVSGSAVEALDAVEIFAVVPDDTAAVNLAKCLLGPFADTPLPTLQTRAASDITQSGQLFLCGGLGSVSPPHCLGSKYVYYDGCSFVVRPGPYSPTGVALEPLNVVGLTDGTILIVGWNSNGTVAWTFDPATNLSTLTSPPNYYVLGRTATLLQDGTVLLAGGLDNAATKILQAAEIYSPTTRSFQIVAGTMISPRAYHTATLLPDGTVLLAGGQNSTNNIPETNTAELFVPPSQSFVAVSTTLPAAVYDHSAVLLANGDVLISGGASINGTVDVANAAVYNFAQRAFAPVGSMLNARAGHTSTLLQDGQVLIAGGAGNGGNTAVTATELFDPGTLTFSQQGSLRIGRSGHGAVLLDNGSVLLIGGDANYSYTAELYDPANATNGAWISLPLSAYGLVAPVQPVTIGGYGIFSFGWVSETALEMSAVLFPPAADASIEVRRDALVFGQSQLLSFAAPIDTGPIRGTTMELTGLISELSPGSTLLLSGAPPLALIPGGASGLNAALPAGTPLMVMSAIGTAKSGDEWWEVETADGQRLTIGATDFVWLSGNGKDIGNIPANIAAKFKRPVRGELITVRTVQFDQGRGTTTIDLTAELRFPYDRTTLTLYGNVVDATQGSTVAREVLGSGNGTVAFQSFTLKQAPLTSVADPGGGVAPALSVSVSGVPWQQVLSLSDSAPQDRHYQLTVDAQGRGQISFGDGINGQRPTTGTDNVTATYRVGAGQDGNVAAGALTRPPGRVGGIRSVLNPQAATGGVGALARDATRRAVALDVQDLDRIVSETDFLSFVLNYADVGQAVVSSFGVLDQQQEPVILVSIAGLDGAVPDPASDSFKSLRRAVAQALPRPIPHHILPYESRRFKTAVEITLSGDGGPQDNMEVILAQATAAIRAAFGAGQMRFGMAVRASDIAAILIRLGAVTASVTALWIPAEESRTNHEFLSPLSARLQTEWLGAEIIAVSDDSDAIELTRQNP
jgi:hypothetical protein